MVGLQRYTGTTVYTRQVTNFKKKFHFLLKYLRMSEKSCTFVRFLSNAGMHEKKVILTLFVVL